MADALGDIFTRAALDAAHVRPAAAEDNLANFFKVSKYWRDVAHLDGEWKETIPKILWVEGVTTVEDTLHHTYYQRFSKFTMMHKKKESVLANPNKSVLFVSDTHLILGSKHGLLNGVLNSFTLPDLEFHNIHDTPPEAFNCPHPHEVVGIILNEENIFVGCRYGSVLRGRLGIDAMNDLGSDTMDVLGSVVDCGEMKDFSGTKDYLVGLFMGVKDKSFCVWRIEDKNITVIYKGGDFCHGLGSTNNNRSYARIGVAGDIVVACNVRALIGFDIKLPSKIRNEVAFHSPVADHIVLLPSERPPMLKTLCVGPDNFLLVDRRDHIATIRRAADFVVVCKFRTYKQDAIGVLNKYVAFMYHGCGGRTTAWDAVTGKRLCDMHKRIKDVTRMAANDRYLVALTKTHTFHIWDATPRGIELGSDNSDNSDSDNNMDNSDDEDE